jgi:hypothetical protein
MFNSVPTRWDVFFQPLSYAAEAFIVMALFGLVILGADGAMVLGGTAAVFAWLIGFVVWLSILRERYAASAAALLQEAQAAYEPAVVVEDVLPVERYVTGSADGTRQLVLTPPCQATQLHQFAVGMVHQLPTTFAYWVVEAKEFTQAQFTAFRDWLIHNGFARVAEGNRLDLTTEGLEMCEWVFNRGVRKM